MERMAGLQANARAAPRFGPRANNKDSNRKKCAKNKTDWKITRKPANRLSTRARPPKPRENPGNELLPAYHARGAATDVPKRVRCASILHGAFFARYFARGKYSAPMPQWSS